MGVCVHAEVERPLCVCVCMQRWSGPFWVCVHAEMGRSLGGVVVGGVDLLIASQWAADACLIGVMDGPADMNKAILVRPPSVARWGVARRGACLQGRWQHAMRKLLLY